MAIGPQSLLNESWYNRLRGKVTEGANVGIRATGSEANDPFFKAREAEGMDDLAKARYQEQRQLFDQAWASRGRQQDRDKAYQQRATWGLTHMNPQAGPDTYLGTQGAPAEGPEAPQPPPIAGMTPPAPPEAYKAPMSGGASQFGYNPAKFNNPVIDRRQKELDAYYARLAKGWR